LGLDSRTYPALLASRVIPLFAGRPDAGILKNRLKPGTFEGVWTSNKHYKQRKQKLPQDKEQIMEWSEEVYVDPFTGAPGILYSYDMDIFYGPDTYVFDAFNDGYLYGPFDWSGSVAF